MNINDIRVGNVVLYQEDLEFEFFKVTSETIKDLNDDDFYEIEHNWKPVSMSRNLLAENFNIGTTSSSDFYLEEGRFKIEDYGNEWWFSIRNIDGSFTGLREFKYLHELQNIYYWISGKELQFNIL